MMSLAARKMMALAGLTLMPLSIETATPNAYGHQTAPSLECRTPEHLTFRLLRLNCAFVLVARCVDVAYIPCT